jgi:hypothetical protein
MLCRRHWLGYGNADFIEEVWGHVGAILPDNRIQIRVEMNALEVAQVLQRLEHFFVEVSG